ncbi:hypothetical protein VUR80DRAFT_3008 [Thermomyces stellatus]
MAEQPPLTPEDPTQDAGDWAQDIGNARVTLQEYEPYNLLDDTTLVIQAFLDNLPPDGQHTLAVHVRRASESNTKLRQLRNCLVDSVLKPLKVAGGTTPKSSSISGPSETARHERGVRDSGLDRAIYQGAAGNAEKALSRARWI